MTKTYANSTPRWLTYDYPYCVVFHNGIVMGGLGMADKDFCEHYVKHKNGSDRFPFWRVVPLPFTNTPPDPGVRKFEPLYDHMPQKPKSKIYREF